MQNPLTALKKIRAHQPGAAGTLATREHGERIALINRRHAGTAGHPSGMQAHPLSRARVHRDDFQTELHDGGSDWKQPGRRYGPSPVGPDQPKKNKVTDRDGNPRIAPLTGAARQRAYAEAGAPYGFTRRQRRRITHKNNHLAAPLGTKES